MFFNTTSGEETLAALGPRLMVPTFKLVAAIAFFCSFSIFSLLFLTLNLPSPGTSMMTNLSASFKPFLLFHSSSVSIFARFIA